ncbi:DUF2182 domain-containing protein [Mesorhizobium sp. M1365]|uniref:copper chaperone n=1 Tax=Mesorhizobium sp. M1365 TaxID=2957090 RepID=UPI0033368DAE
MRLSPLSAMLFASAIAAVGVSVAFPFPLQFSSLCGDLSRVALKDFPALLDPETIIALFSGWLAMLAAMMPPLLLQPLNVVWRLSPRTRRARAVALFCTSYLTIWAALGPLLISAAISMRSLLGLAALPAAMAASMVWSASPLCQAMRNRCHRTRHVGAVGIAADCDCLIFGLTYGLTCAGVCWPWMVAVMTVGKGHTMAMAATAVILFADRSAFPACSRWQAPPFLRFLRPQPRAQTALGRL